MLSWMNKLKNEYFCYIHAQIIDTLYLHGGDGEQNEATKRAYVYNSWVGVIL